MISKVLKNSIWEKEEYFLFARKATLSSFSKNLAFKRLKEYASVSSKILDCGCGDGTLLGKIWHPRGVFWGADVSKMAINMGKTRLKSNKDIHLTIGNIEKLNFPDNYFDLVYTAYTMEHLDRPEKVLKEMIRVTKKNGNLIFISPNYGSPLSFSPSSPPKGETLTSRAIKQFLKSHFYLLKKPSGLDWIKVEPICLEEGRWKPDWDTITEPYLQTLKYFLEKKQVKIIEIKTHLSEEEERIVIPPTPKQKVLRLFKNVFELLEKWAVPPYKYFGPDFMVIGRRDG